MSHHAPSPVRQMSESDAAEQYEREAEYHQQLELQQLDAAEERENERQERARAERGETSQQQSQKRVSPNPYDNESNSRQSPHHQSYQQQSSPIHHQPSPVHHHQPSPHHSAQSSPSHYASSPSSSSRPSPAYDAVDSSAAPSDATMDPALVARLQQAADSLAHAALADAQAAQSLAFEREAALERGEDDALEKNMLSSGGSGNFDFGEEFGIGSTKRQPTTTDEQQQQLLLQPSQQQTEQDAYTTSLDANGLESAQRTFITGMDNSSMANLHNQQQQILHQQRQQQREQDQTQSQAQRDQRQEQRQEQHQQQQQSQAYQHQQQQYDMPPEMNMRMTDEELIGHVEQQMMEYERTAQYLEAEKARQHLESLKKRFMHRRRDDLDKIQSEDVKVFFSMVAQHQENFDRTWSKKTFEHALRADDLIDAIKWKHEEQQRDLYETLRRKRMPKFSVELLNMRKRQVLLAKSKNYVAAEKIKRKADVLESVEIDRIRTAAKDENQLRFQALLKKQEWDRRQLAAKLRIEKKCLLEAKAQDFLRLKKRLRNAEQELKKTHVRQQLLAEKKLLPLYSYNAGGNAGATSGAAAAAASGSGGESERTKSASSVGRGNVLRNTGLQRVMSTTSPSPHPSSSATAASTSSAMRAAGLRSARDLSRRTPGGGASVNSSSYDAQQAPYRTGQAIMMERPSSNSRIREEKE